jgi:hypothetical protein
MFLGEGKERGEEGWYLDVLLHVGLHGLLQRLHTEKVKGKREERKVSTQEWHRVR